MPDIFYNVLGNGLTLSGYLICTAVSLAIGAIIAFVYTRRGSYTQSFVLTLILLPAIVQTVILLVNGNVGTGVAVAGAFSLVRFRSVPGNAREIAVIFLAMTAGLATGTGYVLAAGLFTVILCVVLLVLTLLNIGGRVSGERELKITIPESLDYTEIFDDLFAQYTASCEMVHVKTSNMGSLYKLHYRIRLKEEQKEKEFIDKLRCRNGNLEISCGRALEEERL